MTTILVVEDDQRYREALGRTLRSAGFRVVLVAGLTEAAGACGSSHRTWRSSICGSTTATACRSSACWRIGLPDAVV